MKKCRSCQCDLPLDNFPIHDKKKGNRRSQCRSCYNKERKLANKNNPQWQKQSNANYASNHPLRKLVLTAKSRAKRKGLEFSITEEDLEHTTHCPVLGIVLEHNYGKASDNSPSIDRIDNSKGYVPGNVRVISYRANTLKRDATLEEILKIAEYMSNRPI